MALKFIVLFTLFSLLQCCAAASGTPQLTLIVNTAVNEVEGVANPIVDTAGNDVDPVLNTVSIQPVLNNLDLSTLKSGSACKNLTQVSIPSSQLQGIYYTQQKLYENNTIDVCCQTISFKLNAVGAASVNTTITEYNLARTKNNTFEYIWVETGGVTLLLDATELTAMYIVVTVAYIEDQGFVDAVCATGGTGEYDLHVQCRDRNATSVVINNLVAQAASNNAPVANLLPVSQINCLRIPSTSLLTAVESDVKALGG